jgi:hypothetical protein
MRYLLLLAIVFGLNSSAFAQNPEIVSISPTSVKQGDTAYFTVITRNTHLTKGADVQIYGSKTIYIMQPLSSQVINDTMAIYKCFMYYQDESDSLHICLKNMGERICKNNCIDLLPGPLPPSFTITPNSATQGDTVRITLKGTHTHFKPFKGANGIILYTQAGYYKTTSFDYVNDSLLNVTLIFDYKDNAGTYNFQVNDSSPDPPITLSGGFTLYPGPKPPMLLSCSPTIAKQGDHVTLHIAAKNTHFLSGPNSAVLSNALLPNILSTGVQVINDSTIDADFVFNYNTVPADYVLYIGNQKDGYMLLKSFTLAAGSTPPLLKSVSPGSARKDQQIKMRITGDHTVFMQAPDVVYLLGAYGRSIPSDTIDLISDTLMIARFTFSNSDSVGTYGLTVPYTLASPAMTLPNCFTLYSAGATILSLSPSVAAIGDTVQLTVKALHAHYLSGATTVRLQSIYGGSPVFGSKITAVDDSTLHATVIFTDSLVNGKYTLIIQNDVDNTSKLDAAFTLTIPANLPHILQVTPNQFVYETTGTIMITAKGTHFMQDVENITLRQGSYALHPTSTYVINDTLVKATFKMPSMAELKSQNPFLDVYIEGSNRLALEHGIVVFYPMVVPELETQTEFYIYPNPSSGLFHILQNEKSGFNELEVMDASGRIILRQANTAQTTDLDISSFPQGTYYLRLLTPTRLKTMKLLKN